MTVNFTPIDNLVKKHKDHQLVSKSKESEPVLDKTEEYKMRETIEYQPEEEVKPFVNPVHETISLPPDLKRLGLQAPSSTSFTTYQNVKLPISDDKIVSGLHAPITSSLRWLATLAIYILSRAHLAIRVVGGRAVRIIKR